MQFISAKSKKRKVTDLPLSTNKIFLITKYFTALSLLHSYQAILLTELLGFINTSRSRMRNDYAVFCKALNLNSSFGTS